MGDPLRKVNSGDPLRMPADAFNAFVDAAVAHRSNEGGTTGGARRELPFAQAVPVKNGTGVDLAKFDVVALTGTPAIEPADNSTEFGNRPIATGSTPVLDTDRGRWGIVAEPIGDERIGKVFVDGVVPCRLYVPSNAESNWYAAECRDGVRGVELVDKGTLTVIWREGIASDDVEWALVRIGQPIDVADDVDGSGGSGGSGGGGGSGGDGIGDPDDPTPGDELREFWTTHSINCSECGADNSGTSGETSGNCSACGCVGTVTSKRVKLRMPGEQTVTVVDVECEPCRSGVCDDGSSGSGGSGDSGDSGSGGGGVGAWSVYDMILDDVTGSASWDGEEWCDHNDGFGGLSGPTNYNGIFNSLDSDNPAEWKVRLWDDTNFHEWDDGDHDYEWTGFELIDDQPGTDDDVYRTIDSLSITLGGETSDAKLRYARTTVLCSGE